MMDANLLKGIEFFGFMALAGWLVYRQFIASGRTQHRPESSATDAPETDQNET
ncbi:hypothetical protein [Thiocapsa imhoffii]|uniref:hypothetical protein n=1 Tax=Thiocapsa imhoffii TaxID=382777 RepID=UPI0019038045|nr:hypothetical protein [Thiocapsa imhoffii]